MRDLFYLFTFLVVLAGCSDDVGVVEIKWDRDSCERCRMVISDRHFAVQVRGGSKNKSYRFDDIGCAVHWLNTKPWGNEETTKIWVADYRDGHWLDASTAYYVPKQITPMDFGFGAVAEPVAGSVIFEIAKAQIFRKKHKHY